MSSYLEAALTPLVPASPACAQPMPIAPPSSDRFDLCSTSYKISNENNKSRVKSRRKERVEISTHHSHIYLLAAACQCLFPQTPLPLPFAGSKFSVVVSSPFASMSPAVAASPFLSSSLFISSKYKVWKAKDKRSAERLAQNITCLSYLFCYYIVQRTQRAPSSSLWLTSSQTTRACALVTLFVHFYVAIAVALRLSLFWA